MILQNLQELKADINNFFKINGPYLPEFLIPQKTKEKLIDAIPELKRIEVKTSYIELAPKKGQIQGYSIPNQYFIYLAIAKDLILETKKHLILYDSLIQSLSELSINETDIASTLIDLSKKGFTDFTTLKNYCTVKGSVFSTFISTLENIISDTEDRNLFTKFLTDVNYRSTKNFADQAGLRNDSNAILGSIFLAALPFPNANAEALGNVIAWTLSDKENLLNELKGLAVEQVNTITYDNQIRLFAFKTFKYLILNFGKETVLKNSTRTSSTINSTNYTAIKIPDFFGSGTLIGFFENEQTKESLSSSTPATLRFFDKKISEINDGFAYFSTQWNESAGYDLSFENLQKFIKEISNDKLCADKENGFFVLRQKDLNKVSNNTLNQILYGPPGTGKTHNAISHALAITRGVSVSSIVKEERRDNDIRKSNKAEFDSLVAQGRIQFVTFHQSYSYEEFVEGLKAKVNDSGDVYYEIESGIFKKMCEEAGRKTNEGNIDLKLKDYIDDIINNGNAHSLTTLTGSKPFTVSVNSRGSLKIITGTAAATPLSLPLKHIKNYILTSEISYYPSYVKAIGEDFRTKAGAGLQLSPIDNTAKPYVLIIDEINRGNISRIFGELITLIEDSKRTGRDEALKVKLTYSGADPEEPLFGVPDNLYLIGTMNTADKSIALVDMALRRRFTFIEYAPVYSLLENIVESSIEINLQQLLETINKRIEFLLDRDHLIGHAYFMNVKSLKDLAAVFRNKIIPLLNEYFYNDLKKVGWVLGETQDSRKKRDFSFIEAAYKDKDSSKVQKELFGTLLDEYDSRAEDMYYVNPILADEKYENLKPEYFIQIYNPEEIKKAVSSPVALTPSQEPLNPEGELPVAQTEA